MVLSKPAGSLDMFRLISAFLVVAIHTSPLSSFNDTADFILTRIIARVAVPFFFMVTGYFLFSHIEKGDNQHIKAFCNKIAVIYGICIILYLPLNIYAGYFNKPALWQRIIKDILFEGTYYHLWYLPAVMLGVPLVSALVQKTGIRTAFIVSAALYVIGLFGGSYYGISAQSLFIKSLYDFVFMAFDYTRNGLFFAPIFLVMGVIIFNTKRWSLFKESIIGLSVSVVLLLAEGFLLHSFSLQRHDSMYVMLLPCMYFLFRILLQIHGRSSKNIRTMSMLIYIIHPWIIFFIRGLAKVIQLQKLLIDNSLIHYFVVSILSITVAWMLNSLWVKSRKRIP